MGGTFLRCGISTACLFPQDTLAALQQVIALGAPLTEVFLNTVSEMEPAYIARLERAVQASGIEVVSVHPSLSMLDGYFFASYYEGRFTDGLRVYRRYFEVCRLLGARLLVFHGDHAPNMDNYPHALYAGHFRELAAVGREYGVTLCHENVSYCRLGAPEVVREVRPLLEEAAAFVLDTKQAQRGDVDPLDMLRAMGRDVRHIHISDYSKRENCLPPGRGRFDFSRLLEELRRLDYGGDMVIELYRDGFDEPEELAGAMRWLQGLM